MKTLQKIAPLFAVLLVVFVAGCTSPWGEKPLSADSINLEYFRWSSAPYWDIICSECKSGTSTMCASSAMSDMNINSSNENTTECVAYANGEFQGQFEQRSNGCSFPAFNLKKGSNMVNLASFSFMTDTNLEVCCAKVITCDDVKNKRYDFCKSFVIPKACK
jgi:hypothetical protein